MFWPVSFLLLFFLLFDGSSAFLQQPRACRPNDAVVPAFFSFLLAGQLAGRVYSSSLHRHTNTHTWGTMANRSIQSSRTNILLRYKEAYSLAQFDFRSRDNGHVASL